MTDYQQGKIYRLYSPSRADVGVYYGSTVQKLYQRLCGHKAKKKCSSISIIEIGDTIIELVEDFPCNNLKELEAREYWWIQNNECVNIVKGNFNHKEWMNNWWIKNKEKLKEKRKEWREKNREEILRKQRETRAKAKQTSETVDLAL